MPLDTLLSYNDFGEAKNPALVYCKPASFTKFLFTRYGKQKFPFLFRLAEAESTRSQYQPIQKIYNTTIKTLQEKWINPTFKRNMPALLLLHYYNLETAGHHRWSSFTIFSRFKICSW